ncbi:MAG: peptide chain release factor 1 [Chitinivibrionales bacterium]|nr:peptide chain release factor 1 [Chitinivibrionales bacterium]
MIQRVREALARHAELEKLLADPEVSTDPKRMEKLGREYNALGKSVPTLKRYEDAAGRLEQARDILKNEADEELLEMAREELTGCENELDGLDDRVKRILVPRDPDDLKNAIMEIRAGTGGVEAGLFAGDLHRMYVHYAELRKWGIEVMSTSEGDLGGLKEIIFMVSGEGAYGALKFESGVHRVQRVPKTESQGRIHTSAATVAVFPEADEVEMAIDPADLRIDVYRSSGPGGQSVNTTDSAVRVVHAPTGITVTCQDEKSQHKNKAKALKVLQSRLYDRMQADKLAQESASRRSMVGTGDRSAKIRTYNFPQNRVTDHRINLTLHKLDQILAGNLQELSDALADADMSERVKTAGT